MITPAIQENPHVIPRVLKRCSLQDCQSLKLDLADQKPSSFHENYAKDWRFQRNMRTFKALLKMLLSKLGLLWSSGMPQTLGTKHLVTFGASAAWLFCSCEKYSGYYGTDFVLFQDLGQARDVAIVYWDYLAANFGYKLRDRL